MNSCRKEQKENACRRRLTETQYTRRDCSAISKRLVRSLIEKENPTGVTAATIGMARILGLIIDRREVGDVGAFDNMTDEELMSAAARKARELGIAGPRLVEDDKSV